MQKINQENLTYFTADSLQSQHGFFTRKGGVSQGYAASLNGNLKIDSPENVHQNKELATFCLDSTPHHLRMGHQVHKTNVLLIQDMDPFQKTYEADGFVTNVPGLTMGIITADCAPILLEDPSGVVGAVHAGWRGLLAGVVEEGVNAMVSLGANPSTIRAAIGPCIAVQNYEVDQGFRESFAADGSAWDHFFQTAQRDRHYMFDLRSAVRHSLERAGVQMVQVSTLDTYAMPDLFFSCRRAFKKNEPSFGCQLSLIKMREA